MNGHGIITIEGLKKVHETLKQEINGKDPSGPYEFDSSLDFPTTAEAANNEELPLAQRRMAYAVLRDARYGSAGSVYLRAFSMSQSLREVYDHGKTMIEKGIKK